MEWEGEGDHLQKKNAPEMIPLATAGGNNACASFVIGNCSAVNIAGGMTSRSLRKREHSVYTRDVCYVPVHG